MSYYPTINPAAYSLAWLQTRRDELARQGLRGTKAEKQSAQRKAELAAIDAGMRARGTRPTQLPRTRVLPGSAPGDTARMQAHAQAPRTPTGCNGYSQQLHAVARDFNPPKYERYC